MGDSYEFEVICRVCGGSEWIYGTHEDADDYDRTGFIHLDCQEEDTNG